MCTRSTASSRPSAVEAPGRAPPPAFVVGNAPRWTGPRSSNFEASRSRSAPCRRCPTSTSRCGAARSWPSSATTVRGSRPSSNASRARTHQIAARSISRARRCTSTARRTPPSSASRWSTRISPFATTSTSSRTCISAARHMTGSSA